MPVPVSEDVILLHETMKPLVIRSSQKSGRNLLAISHHGLAFLVHCMRGRVAPVASQTILSELACSQTINQYARPADMTRPAECAFLRADRAQRPQPKRP
jgi:hypothetical protein